MLLSGSAAPAADGAYVIAEGPREDDPVGFSAHETIRILKRESATALRTHRKGELRHRAEGWNGTHIGGWDDSDVPGGNYQPMGRTKAMGIAGRPTEMMTLYATCFLEAPRPAANDRTRSETIR